MENQMTYAEKLMKQFEEETNWKDNEEEDWDYSKHFRAFTTWLINKIEKLDKIILEVEQQKAVLVNHIEYLNEYCNYLLGAYTEEEFKKIAEKYAIKD